MTTATRPAGTDRVEIATGTGDIPREVWEALAPPDDPMWSWQFFRAMEYGRLGPDEFGHVTVRRGGEVAAVLPTATFHRLPVGDLVGPDRRRWLAPVRAVWPGLLRWRVMVCGNLLGRGRVLTADPDDDRLAAAAVRAAVDHAARSGIGMVVLKDVPPAELPRLAPGPEFFTVPSLPDTRLALEWSTLDEYVAARPAKPRRNARNKLRRFAAADGLRLEVTADLRPLAGRFTALYHQVLERAPRRLDVWTAEMFDALAGDPDACAVTCWRGDDLVGFLLCLFRGRRAVGIRIGLDYAAAPEAHVYHNLHYRAIELAIDRRCDEIRFAQTTYQPKLEMGCELMPLAHAVTHTNPLARAALRRLLPWALADGLPPELAGHVGRATVSPPEPRRS